MSTDKAEQGRPTPLEIIYNMRKKNFYDAVILDEVEKELLRLTTSPASPANTEGVEFAEWIAKGGHELKTFTAQKLYNQYKQSKEKV